MNTSAEFFEWILRSESQEPDVLDKLELSHSFAAVSSIPALTHCSDSDISYLEEDSSYSDGSLASGCKPESRHKDLLLKEERRVSFHPDVEIREHSICVGDHPLCYDGLPLSLDWAHTETPIYRHIDQSRHRTSRYRAPRRMDFAERRERVFDVQTDPGDFESERSTELNMMIKLLQNSWSMTNILPAPKLSLYEEIEEGEWCGRRSSSRRHAKKPGGQEQVFQWKRNIHRSKAIAK